MKQLVRSMLNRMGYELVRAEDHHKDDYPDFDPFTRSVVERVRHATMVSPERISAVVEAVRYVDRFGIPGSLVECGVWRGGSSMAMALAHQASSSPVRDIYLYDTFEGMPPPDDADVDYTGRPASSALAIEPLSAPIWAHSTIDVVRGNMRATAYPQELLHYVRGRVEDTVPETVPPSIAVLRLDTDWFESTRHELLHLAPLVSRYGVLVVDDYGHWQGARRAVDEWLADRTEPVLLARTDYTGRIAVLP